MLAVFCVTRSTTRLYPSSCTCPMCKFWLDAGDHVLFDRNGVSRQRSRVTVVCSNKVKVWLRVETKNPGTGLSSSSRVDVCWWYQTARIQSCHAHWRRRTSHMRCLPHPIPVGLFDIFVVNRTSDQYNDSESMWKFRVVVSPM